MIEHVPALAVPAMGLAALAAGIWFGRRTSRDALESARRLSAAASTYWARADQARSYIRAIESPTVQVPVVELIAATSTRRERVADWAHEQAARIREAVTPQQATPDWAEGEMTDTFRRIMEQERWPDGDQLTLPANPSPWAPPRHELPAPAPTPAPAVVMAPRGPQTPPRWQNRPAPAQRDRTIRVAARSRQWTGPLLGLTVPALEIPTLPAPFRMPTPRLRPTPALLARLPQDPTRAYRTKVVAA